MLEEGRPIYLQIADRIRDEIVRGELEADAPVPSSNRYARELRINPATAAKGLQALADEGVLYKRRGIGMFVAPEARERLLADRRARFFREVVDPVATEARAIGVDLADVIAHLDALADAVPTPAHLGEQE